MYRETEGVHAAGLFNTAGDLICIVEDVGRHNAIDKVIGYILLNNVDAGDTFLVTTGRLTSEMAAKIGRVGIPVAVTRTAVSDLGLAAGEKRGLTIIGFVRDAGTAPGTGTAARLTDRAAMKIYAGAARVPCE